MWLAWCFFKESPHMDWMFLSAPKFMCWNLTPSEIVLGEGVFRGWLGYLIINGISALVKEPVRAPSVPCHVKTWQEGTSYEAGSNLSDTKAASALIFVFKMVRNKCLLFISHLVYGLCSNSLKRDPTEYRPNRSSFKNRTDTLSLFHLILGHV